MKTYSFLKTKNHFFLFLIPLFFLGACSSGVSTEGLDDSESITEPQNQEAMTVYLLASDFSSNAQIFKSTTDANDGLELLPIQGLGSAAYLYHHQSHLLVLHTGFSNYSYDNVLILNDENYAVKNQVSLGAESNPLNLIIDDNQNIWTVQNLPQNNECVHDNQGKPAQLILLEDAFNQPANAFHLCEARGYQFFNLLDPADYEYTIGAEPAVLVDQKIYLGFQGFGSGYSRLEPAILTVFDTQTKTVVQQQNFEGRNPKVMAYDQNSDLLFVAHMALSNVAEQNYEIEQPYGGVEVMQRSDLTTLAFIKDDTWEGYVENIQVGFGFVFIQVSQFDREAFEHTSTIYKAAIDAENPASLNFEIMIPENDDVRAMALSPNGQLWLGYRNIAREDGFSAQAKVEVYDVVTNEIIKTLEPLVPVTSIAFKDNE